MNEKKWTDDERDEAFDRGMETMQRVALELYRRGREPLLEELEEARARNADMRAMLEQVTRDRDHVEESLVRLEAQRDEARSLVDQLGSARDKAEAELRELQRSTSEALAQALEWQRERDEARAEVERLRETKDYLRTWLSSEELEGLRVKAAEHPLLWEEIHHLKAEVERLRTALLEVQTSESAAAWFADGFHDGWKAGAEAMREACAVRAQRYLGLLIAEGAKTAEAIRALPIPEEP